MLKIIWHHVCPIIWTHVKVKHLCKKFSIKQISDFKLLLPLLIIGDCYQLLILIICSFFPVDGTGLHKNRIIYYHQVISIFTYSYNSLHLLFRNFKFIFTSNYFSLLFFTLFINVQYASCFPIISSNVIEAVQNYQVHLR